MLWRTLCICAQKWWTKFPLRTGTAASHLHQVALLSSYLHLSLLLQLIGNEHTNKHTNIRRVSVRRESLDNILYLSPPTNVKFDWTVISVEQLTNVCVLFCPVANAYLCVHFCPVDHASPLTLSHGPCQPVKIANSCCLCCVLNLPVKVGSGRGTFTTHNHVVTLWKCNLQPVLFPDEFIELQLTER